MKTRFQVLAELYSGGGKPRTPSDDEILSSAPFERVQEHFRVKAEERRKLREAEARAAAERTLLEWKG
jgi:hypothetical protein